MELVPRTSGPLVPVAAIKQNTDGSAYVTTKDGADHPVTIIVADSGSAIVEGIDVGDEVRLATAETDRP